MSLDRTPAPLADSCDLRYTCCMSKTMTLLPQRNVPNLARHMSALGG